MITVPSHDGDTCPGHIHNPGQVPRGARSASLVGARCSFQTAERRATVKGEAVRWLESHVDYSGSDCLIWPFAQTGNGYALVTGKYGRQRGNRLMCELAHGPAPDQSMYAAHACGNAICVNPKHLRWATPQENSDDKYIHGTARFGPTHPQSKISEAVVRHVRELHATGQWSIAALSRKFEISTSHASDLVHRKRWRCLDD